MLVGFGNPFEEGGSTFPETLGRALNTNENLQTAEVWSHVIFKQQPFQLEHLIRDCNLKKSQILWKASGFNLSGEIQLGSEIRRIHWIYACSLIGQSGLFFLLSQKHRFVLMFAQTQAPLLLLFSTLLHQKFSRNKFSPTNLRVERFTGV